MRDIDETDEEILTLLLEDSRRPYSEIADAVGLSAPAVSDRVDRLREVGLIEKFTVELDRSLLRSGHSLLLTLEGTPGSGPSLAETLEADDRTEHVFRTVDDTVVCTLVGDESDVEALVDALDEERIREYDIQLLGGSSWQPTVRDSTLAPECVECGNTVTSEGERERIDGELYHFCCSSCAASFRERYEELQDGV
ncbi:AsnC family transcriptional regulator [Halovenus sp. WSH3]|uniref:AsnC family transcriptional regulator n=1 Tax=Halovenus carboxidivorans TaxID=2692199 RepID=A0A6B0TBP0_9EURY|nr:AsnC family transcriptional regulator [Halovenus carboxidivorans]MXR50619.1 AsnC family transcriptional regulator [Halovenus carboxidivorans]